MYMEKPTPGDEAAVQAFMDSFAKAGETVVNGSAGLDIDRDYPKWLAYLADIAAGDEGFVPSEVYLAKTEGGAVAGILDVRPRLPKAKESFGHIGYAVAPPCRRRGVAAQMLHFGTELLQNAGVTPVIACCYAENASSVGVLEKGGYRRRGFYTDEGGGTVLVFHRVPRDGA